MIDPSKLEDFDFLKDYEALEEQSVIEIENIIIAQLIENGRVTAEPLTEDTLEFAGKTNFKLRVKRRNKNVWSIPTDQLRNAIRMVLREGKIREENDYYVTTKTGKPAPLDRPLKLLLGAIPEEEYARRSFVGFPVEHEVYGEGFIRKITDTGNVEIQFENRVALLKPGFFRLKIETSKT